MNQQPIYDVVIIGAGPAGLTASIYASRYKLKNLVIGKVLGGELSLASKIENLPGSISIPGVKWGEKVKEQVVKLGAELLIDGVEKIEKKVESVEGLPNQSENRSDLFGVYTESGKRYWAKTLIVATGSERRRLNIPGEKEYVGRGVSFCTSCDAPFFRDKTVALIGGSDAAVSGAVHTAEYAKKVYVIYRKDKLRAEPIWIEQWQKIEKTGRGEAIYNTNITKILGYKDIKILREKGEQFSNLTIEQLESKSQDQVAAVELDRPYKNSKHLLVDGVFIEIGGVPGTGLVKPLGVRLNEAGYVIVDEEMRTNIEALFCAGDMVDKSRVMQQAITAMAQGAIAAASAYKCLKGEKAPQIVGI